MTLSSSEYNTPGFSSRDRQPSIPATAPSRARFVSRQMWSCTRACGMPLSPSVEHRLRPLPSPPSVGRFLGAAAPSGSGSVPIDVILADPSHTYTLSLYCVDFALTPWGDGQVMDGNRTQEVYLLTLPDLNPMTLRQGLRDFNDGVWLSYNIKGSVRVRVSTMRGDYGCHQRTSV